MRWLLCLTVVAAFLVSTTTFATDDAGVSQILAPIGNNCGTTVNGQVELTNFGTTPLTSVTINWGIDGSTTQMWFWTGSLNTGESDTISFTSITAAIGTHTFDAHTSSPNGTADINNTNDTAQSSFASVAAVGLGMSGFNAGCWNTASAAASASGIGGTTPYSFSWSNGETAASINGLFAGSYTVTLTDASGCTASNSIFLSSPGEFIIDTDSTETAVAGATDGSATVTITSGGSTPFAYLWANGQTTATATGLASGNHCVTITDANLCDSTVCVDVTDPPPCFIGLTLTSSNVDCFGDSTGEAAAVPVGLAPYNYLWSNGSTDSMLTGLPAGTYTVSVVDANFCIGEDSVTITQPNSLPMALPTGNHPSVPGYSDGSLYVSATGGTPGYGYLWYNGTSSQNQGLQSAGTYCVTVSDARGCTDSACVTLVDPPCNMVLTPALTHVACYSESNGAMTTGISAGYPPFNFAWSNGSTDSIITNLVAGPYSVTITDEGGCTATLLDTIVEPELITGSVSITHASCDSANGGATVVASGGVQPYSYLWPNGADSSTVFNLIGGTYTMTVTDTNGCQDGIIVAINTTESPNVVTTSINATCAIDNGEIITGVSDGTLPYTYNWSNGTNLPNVTGLAAGDYTITVSDANGCMDVDTVTITDATAPQVTVLANDAACNLNNGNITLAVLSGIMPYTYNWSTGSFAATVSGLSGGSYIYSVTDAVGCLVTDTVIIGTPTPPTVTTTNQPASACGANDGSATATPTGTAPLSLQWSSGNMGFNTFNLAPGIYTVTVTDGNGCTATSATTVVALGGPIAPSGFNDLDCYGGTNGVATVTPALGTAPYAVEWSTGGTTNTIIGLVSATYTVTVTDANNCTASSSVFVPQPDSLAVAINVTGATQGNTNGNAIANVSGGTAPYTYEWESGNANPVELALGMGDYTMTVTDAMGCVAETDFTIGLFIVCPTVLVSTFPTDCDVDNGTATAAVFGGTAPFTYDWSTGGVTATETNLGAGVVFVTVTDANGCDTVLSATVTNNVAPFLTPAITNPACGSATGSIGITPSQGLMPYTFSWSTGAVTTDINNLVPGTYTVSVTDDNGCSTEQSFDIVTGTTAPVVSISKINTICGDSTGSLSAMVANGQPPYAFNWSNGSTATFQNELPSGIYELVVTDANGCTASGTAFLDDIATGTLAVSGTDLGCFGDTNGVVTALLSGATLGGYLWSTGDTSATVDSLLAGTYTITATDINGCNTGGQVTIGEPDELALQVSATDGSCGQNTGTVLAAVSGGSPNYAYIWSNGVAADHQVNLAGGTYACTITDAGGCTASDSAVVTVPVPLSINLVSVNETCTLGNGSLSASVSGGSFPFFYTWSTGQTTTSLSNLSAGTYTVSVSTAAGCSASAVGGVNNIGGLTTNISPDQTICLGDIVLVDANGGATYDWSTGDSTASIQLQPGISDTYTVTISDATGCTEELSTTVTVMPTPVVTIVQTNDIVCPGTNVTLTAVGAVDYEWDSGELIDSITVAPYVTTSYVVIGYINGCPSFPVSATVTMDPLAPIALAAANTSNTYLDSGGAVTFTSAGTVAAAIGWDFNGNGTIDSNDPNPTYNYVAAGVFNAILHATIGTCTTYDTVAIAVIEAVGLEGEHALVNSVKLFPNPTRGQATVAIELATPEQVRIEVFSSLGVLVEQQMLGLIEQQRATVDLSGQAAGLYLVKITAGGHQLTRRITKAD